MASHIDEKLLEWATPREKQIINSLNETGSQRTAASHLGLTRATVQGAVRRVRKRAAAQGYSPEHDLTHIIPEPYVAKGHSTYYDKEGKPRQQWVKTRLNEQAHLELVKAAVESFVEGVGPVKVPPAPRVGDSDVIPWLQIGDCHLGMLAHEAETGKNFDLKIAEREVCAAFSILLSDLPQVDRLVLNDLGDFTHYENFSGTTEASGNALDYDTRYPRMINAYVRIMRFLVDMALTKAKVVDVIVNQGNHSRTNDIWMRQLLLAAYPGDRVNVLPNVSPFPGYRMGNTLVMVHHGDSCRPANLPSVMVSDFRKDFGETEFHYIDTGHIHHRTVAKDYPSISVESFNTLAPGDKWHHDKGYRARQSMTMIFRSRTYGEIGRRLLPIQQVWDAVKAGHAGSGATYIPSRREPFTA